jgi:hypothetical protein
MFQSVQTLLLCKQDPGHAVSTQKMQENLLILNARDKYYVLKMTVKLLNLRFSLIYPIGHEVFFFCEILELFLTESRLKGFNTCTFKSVILT